MMSGPRVRILGIGGTVRSGSATELALRTALKAAAREGAETTLFTGPDLILPMYSPHPEGRTAEAKQLVSLFRTSDAIIIASPSYHGSLSGLLKNALDYTEDLRLDKRPYLEGRAVGCIVCAAGWQAAGITLVGMRSIVHALRGWPTPMGAALNTSIRIFDENGHCVEPGATRQLEIIGQQVYSFAAMRASFNQGGMSSVA